VLENIRNINNSDTPATKNNKKTTNGVADRDVCVSSGLSLVYTGGQQQKKKEKTKALFEPPNVVLE